MSATTRQAPHGVDAIAPDGTLARSPALASGHTLPGSPATAAAAQGQSVSGQPPTPSAGAEPQALPEEAEQPQITPQAAPRRTLKVVVTLQPVTSPASQGGARAAADYRAILAVGAEGCDPLLRCVAAGSLAAALDEVSGLAAEAEARWQSQPRNPLPALQPVQPRAVKVGKDGGVRAERAHGLPTPAPPRAVDTTPVPPSADATAGSTGSVAQATGTAAAVVAAEPAPPAPAPVPSPPDATSVGATAAARPGKPTPPGQLSLFG